jgi:hypothetical protein
LHRAPPSPLRTAGVVALGAVCGGLAAGAACAVWGAWVTRDAPPNAPGLAAPAAFAAVVGALLGAGLGPAALALLPGVRVWRAAAALTAGAFVGGVAAALSPAFHPVLTALAGVGVAAGLLRRRARVAPAP